MSRRDQQDKKKWKTKKKISAGTGPKLVSINMSAPQVRTHPELKSRSMFLFSFFLSSTPMPIEIGRVHKAELDSSFRMPRLL